MSPGDSVVVEWTYTSDGSAAAIEGRFNFDNTHIDSVDYTDCTDGWGAATHFGQCLDQGATEDNVFFQILDTGADPLPSGSGFLTFNTSAAAPVPLTIDLEWVPGSFVVDGGPAVDSTNGSIELLAGPPAILDVTPPSINFGTGVAPTTLGPETVTIANTGAGGAPDLNVTALGFSGVDAGQFSMAAGGTCPAVPFPLAEGASCTVDIELDANAVAMFTADFDVSSDVGDVAVALEGEGTAGPQSTLTVTPDPMAFGVVDLGNLPITDTFVAENTGDAGSSLTISGFSLAGDAEFQVGPGGDNCSGATLNAGDTCTVEIEFNSAANGVFAATGSFASDANTGANQDIAISGEADSVPNLVVNPAFGSLDLGMGSPGDVVSANGSVENTGSASGDFSCVLGGADAGLFSTTPDPLVGPVAAGDSVDFSVACAIPTGAAEGDVFNATLTCTGDLDGAYELSCGASLVPVIPVPTMQPWALILFSILMLAVGGFSIRFFRAS